VKSPSTRLLQLSPKNNQQILLHQARFGVIVSASTKEIDMKQEKDRWSREKKFARDMVAYYENWVERFPKSVAAKEKLGEWKEKFNSI